MREMSFQKQRDPRLSFLMHCLTLNVIAMQTSTQKPLYWGRTYDRDGSNRFVFWHRRFDHLVQLSGFLKANDPIIGQIKRGVQVRTTAGLPHFGYAFDWQPLKNDPDPEFLIQLGIHFSKWLSGHLRDSDEVVG
jgi:hypothetical protein